MKITSEMLEKAKTVEPVEEFIRLATEKEVEVTEEQIRRFYAMNHNSGELADDELNNVAGGWCYNDGRPVITVGEQHDCFVCAECGDTIEDSHYDMYGYMHMCHYKNRNIVNNCGNCKYCIYEKGLWLCNNPANHWNA